ncbi:tetratricopeptide repeat protein [Robiginitalea sp. IMCC43444]|uniref:tetratricopeptide repeat protein n=1 Tax=Robiginitalea sp. IMCC43444 TaxID=3459121 RepID=UPI004040EED7
MKKDFYAMMVLVLGMAGLSYGQAQNPECMTNLSIYAEHAKVKNYEAAYQPWKMVYETCPGINKANFSYGEKILEHKIDNSSGAEKQAFIKELTNLYDTRRQYFSKNYTKAEDITDKVNLMYDNKMISDDEIYLQLSQAFKEDRANFDNPKSLYLYFSSLVDLHGAGKKELQEVFDVYDDVTEKIEEENEKYLKQINLLLPKEEAGTLSSKDARRLKSYNSYSENYGKIAGSIDSKLGALADCENLIPLYQRSFEEKKGDIAWVKRAVGRMFAKECTDDPLFRKLFEAQLALEPSASAYLYGGTLKAKDGDNRGAIADFDKAAELETDARKKSSILYKAATIARKFSKSQARAYARRAIDANGSNGNAYLLIASLYASSANECGSTPFEKRSVYWLAADMARRAGRVDPSISGRASQSAASYEAKAPSKTDIFNSGMAGKQVSFPCWVGGSVTVPNL